jgi:hypothetical protein
MKKAAFLAAFAILFLTAASCFGRPRAIIGEDFRSFEINKRVHEYPIRFDLSTPLDSFITFKYLKSNGKQGLYRSANSYRIRGFFPPAGTPDSEIKNDAKEPILQTNIKEMIIYKDYVAGIITDYADPMCIITYLTLEDGKWLNAGEGFGNDLNDARERFKENAPTFLRFIDRIRELKTVPTDASSFTEYLRNHGQAPKEFILDALAHHKIVIYGELHRRKASWDLLRTIIHDPHFAERAGTIFLEDHFNKILDRNTQMAKIISETISAQKDQRHNLFIVGEAHAYKSSVPGIAVGRRNNESRPTAAAQLSKTFSPQEVFSIFQHCPIISNNGTIHGKIRNGLFDKGAGSLESNYDAYLFLEPLESEPEEYYLYDIITDTYVQELVRRTEMTKTTVNKWFGVEEITQEAIISKLKSKYENKKRWADIKE